MSVGWYIIRRMSNNYDDGWAINHGLYQSLREPTQAFIQWKGTDVCMDLHCPKCKHHNHYDGDFAYEVQCAGCGQVFEMKSLVEFRPVDKATRGTPLQSELDD